MESLALSTTCSGIAGAGGDLGLRGDDTGLPLTRKQRDIPELIPEHRLAPPRARDKE
ncbi:hypothetical protein [Kribbella sp. VKM Ac-2571]|uniref:hypothetical protein n=1 Tax=Kribbella sp. VKM Ac-2571 TaxID=2512222 RepID=UPI001EDDB6BB|nr:hypothetical protein [Kribbella sp. VKM Ac-2571]